MLVGALLSSSDGLTSYQFFYLSIVALLATAAVQSFNDYEDRQQDMINNAAKSIRPICTGELSANFVLTNGYVCATLSVVLSAVFAKASAAASFTMFLMMLLTRWYSALKKWSLIHHIMLPIALGLTALHGALMVQVAAASQEEERIPTMTYYVVASISLIDIGMNIVGSFKDLFDGCGAQEERVLPVVIGRRPAIIVATLVGTAGIFVQAVPLVLLGFRSNDGNNDNNASRRLLYPIIPLTLGLIITLRSRYKLYQNPVAEQGYKALKAGRAVECLCFPAMMFAARPPLVAGMILGSLVVTAMLLQKYIKEAILPDDDKTSSEKGANVDTDSYDFEEDDTTSIDGSYYRPLLKLLHPHPCWAEFVVVTICAGIILLAFAIEYSAENWNDITSTDRLIRLYIPLICCAIGYGSVAMASREQNVAGLLKNDWAYVSRYLRVIVLMIFLDMTIHFAFTREIDFIALSNWAALVGSASAIIPIGFIGQPFVSSTELRLNVPVGVLIMILQVGQAIVSVLGAQSTHEIVVLLVVRRLVILVIVHMVSRTNYTLPNGQTTTNNEMLQQCRTLEYVAHSAVAQGRDIVLDQAQLNVIGSTLLKTPILGGESMSAGAASRMRVFDKIFLTEQILACSSPSCLCSNPVALGHLGFMHDMFKSHDTHLNPELENSELCLYKVEAFLSRDYETFAARLGENQTMSLLQSQQENGEQGIGSISSCMYV